MNDIFEYFLPRKFYKDVNNTIFRPVVNDDLVASEKRCKKIYNNQYFHFDLRIQKINGNQDSYLENMQNGIMITNYILLRWSKLIII